MHTPTCAQVFDLAVEHHRAGRLAEAESLYRQVLGQQPKHAGALHYLGVIAHQVGRNQVAVDLIHQAVALQPANAEAYNNLGKTLKELGRLDEAIAACRRAVALQPDLAEAHDNLGNALLGKGLLAEAIAAYRQAIALKPAYQRAHSNLGAALVKNDQAGEAIAVLRQALALDDQFAQAHANLGTALMNQGKLDEAIASFRRAVALNPRLPEAWANLAHAQNDKGDAEEAIFSSRQAIALQPELPEAWCNLGHALNEKGEPESAVAACRRAIAFRPLYAEAHANLGAALIKKGEYDEGVAAYRQAIALEPNFVGAYVNLGASLSELGELQEALAVYREALAIRPECFEARDNFLLALQSDPAQDAQAVALEHRRWDEVHGRPLARLIAPHTNQRDPDRRLRIGYVSPDFRAHAVCRFALPLLGAQDHAGFEIFCYANVAKPDPVTHQVQQHADLWRMIYRLSDDQIARMIRDDRIDILVDLAGHTAGNSLLVFARKPAPVQVTYLGYPATTGLQAMDYRLTDALADPSGQTDSYCSEQLIRLPQTAWCYQPPPSPPVNPLPALQNNHIVFGSFNSFTKVNEALLKIWAAILHRVPGSRLVLKRKALGVESVQDRVRQVMRGMGIGPDRLDLRGWVPDSEHIAQYHEIDIALDTFPYHGTTTTCEAMWMGVPVITQIGQSHVSRVGLSLLSSVGLGELAAATSQQYENIAVELALDLPRLQTLRSSLRERMEQSPLMDAPRFARNVEAAYRQMWRSWCTSATGGNR